MLSNCNDIYCRPAGFSSEEYLHTKEGVAKIIYVADPMCSWCYGMQTELKKLKAYFDIHQPNLKFTITVGGLRPGGGENWDENLKLNLIKDWNEVKARTNQPFSYKLLEKENFNYDTEPACRAVVAARQLNPKRELNFFFDIQHKFYAEAKDPTEIGFYESICLKNEIDFTDFIELFVSEEVKNLTHREFIMNREWGVTDFPTIIFQQEDDLYAIAKGFTSFEALKTQIEKTKYKAVN